jgi:copper chaperone CopZ
MRRLRIPIAFLAVVLAGALASCNSDSGEAAHAEWKINAPGIHCEGCTATIEESLAKMPGVDSVYADLATKDVLVFADSSRTSRDDVVHMLDAMGYLTPPENP